VNCIGSNRSENAATGLGETGGVDTVLATHHSERLRRIGAVFYIGCVTRHCLFTKTTIEFRLTHDLGLLSFEIAPYYVISPGTH
jgi:hypothetical protein